MEAKTFVSVLVESTKSIDLIVATKCHGSIYQASRSLPASPGDLGFIAIFRHPRSFGRAGWHEVGVVGRSRTRCSNWMAEGPLAYSCLPLLKAGARAVWC